MVSKDRVGLLALAGEAGTQREWLEIDLQGKLIGRWRLDGPSPARVFLTSDGQAFTTSSGDANSPMMKLDRTAGTWKPVTAPSDGHLYGADGNKLVFADWPAGSFHLRWFNQP